MADRTREFFLLAFNSNVAFFLHFILLLSRLLLFDLSRTSLFLSFTGGAVAKRAFQAVDSREISIFFFFVFTLHIATGSAAHIAEVDADWVLVDTYGTQQVMPTDAAAAVAAGGDDELSGADETPSATAGTEDVDTATDGEMDEGVALAATIGGGSGGVGGGAASSSLPQKAQQSSPAVRLSQSSSSLSRSGGAVKREWSARDLF